jgi:hypothetical protein
MVNPLEGVVHDRSEQGSIGKDQAVSERTRRISVRILMTEGG